ncbi:MAG TPA: hypothetical protein VGH30_12080 [Jatrophihabitantaceae bacterium]
MITGQRTLLRLLGGLLAVAPAIAPPAHATMVPMDGVSTISSIHPPTRKQLPLGGRKILGHYRVVTYYGAPGSGDLGILGSKPPKQIAVDIEHRAREWRGYGLRVQPAMELIATVAQGAPGPDGTYSKPIPLSEVRRYLRVAHQDKMLLILDFQPGRAEFLDQVRTFAPILRDPSVSVALDPEWKMHGDQVPAKVVGHTTAGAVNAVRDYLARMVRTYRLPDKLLVVHQFQPQMIRNRDRIEPAHGVEVLYHADGFGTPSEKRATWHRLAFPRRPYGAGFKLFTKQDTPMLSPDRVMALRPRVDLISYQ